MASLRLSTRRFTVVGLRRGVHRNPRHTPKLFKGLLFLFVATFGLIGIRLLPSVSSEGWWPTLSLFFALVLIAAALVKVLRTR